MKKRLLFGLLLLGGIGIGVVLSQRYFSSGIVKNPLAIIPFTEQELPKPSPIPFQEMTIPHLRSRRYESSLGQFVPYAQTSNYESFLTSYLSDGSRVNGLVTKPIGEQPRDGWPAIIFIHGYIPPTQYQTTERYQDYVDYLAKNGFVVFKIDLRGHGDSEGEPGGAYYSEDYIIDTLNAYAALQGAEFIDGNKIGLWGHSMAGNVVLRTMAAKPEIPAAVIWAGAVYSYEDFQKYRIADASYRPPSVNVARQRRRQELFDAHGEFSKENEFWKQVAPTNYLTDLQGAIQLHHAIDDDVVNIGYSRDLNGLLDNTSIEHELYEYQTGGHNLTGSSFGTAMQRTVDFFTQYLSLPE